MFSASCVSVSCVFGELCFGELCFGELCFGEMWGRQKTTFSEKSSFLDYSLSEPWLKNIEEWSCAFRNISECGGTMHFSEFNYTDSNSFEQHCKLFLCHRHKQSYRETVDNDKLMHMERRLQGYKLIANNVYGFCLYNSVRKSYVLLKLLKAARC